MIRIGHAYVVAFTLALVIALHAQMYLCDGVLRGFIA